jgi:hypothetical protein
MFKIVISKYFGPMLLKLIDYDNFVNKSIQEIPSFNLNKNTNFRKSNRMQANLDFNL